MHLELVSKDIEKDRISKKDMAGLIKRMLYKCSEKERREVFPGCWIEKKSLTGLTKELVGGGKRVLVLDGKGEMVRGLENEGFRDCVFVIGDQDGLPKKEMKKFEKVSVGKETYFASQVFTILHNEMDIRNL
jgi:tRNA pseudouridine-54 N-methylase